MVAYEEVKPNVFLKKTWYGYRVVYPPVINGKINWRNLLIGDPEIFILTLLFLILLILLIISYRADLNKCIELLKQCKNIIPIK